MKRNQDEWTILGRFLRELTYFTKAERRGIMVLLCIVMATWTLPTLLPYFLPEKNTQLMEYAAKADEHFALMENSGRKEAYSKGKTSTPKNSNEKRKSTKTIDYKPALKEITLFPFNPNTLPMDSFSMLGLSDRVIQTLEKYRSKGGTFRSKEDLKKIYGLQDGDYERLAPYISIPERKAYPSPVKSNQYASAIIDINTASVEQWQQLKGIGPYYSKKIVTYRERLGGFHQIEQVGEVYGLPDSVFQKIKPSLVLHSKTPNTIRLDSTGIKRLQSHPYVNKRQAKGLAAFIQNHGTIENPQSLWETGLFSLEEWERLVPYLQ